MIEMSKAATNATSSSEDDGNYSCNPQGIYDKNERLIPAITFYYTCKFLASALTSSKDTKSSYRDLQSYNHA